MFVTVFNIFCILSVNHLRTAICDCPHEVVNVEEKDLLEKEENSKKTLRFKRDEITSDNLLHKLFSCRKIKSVLDLPHQLIYIVTQTFIL